MEHETASVAEEKQAERAAAAAPPAAEDEDSEASSLSSSNRAELDTLVKGMADSGAPAAGGGSKSAKDNMRSIAQEWTVAGAGEAGKNRNIQSRTVKIDGHDVLRWSVEEEEKAERTQRKASEMAAGIREEKAANK